MLVGWVWARICIAAGWALSDRLGGVLDNPRAVIGAHSGLLTWDGLFYRDIAIGWYDGVPDAGARFFPLYPALGRTLAPLFGGREDWSLVVIANVAAFAGALVLWRLVKEVIEGAARRTAAGRTGNRSVGPAAPAPSATEPRGWWPSRPRRSSWRGRTPRGSRCC